MKVQSSINLEERIVILEKKVEQILKHLGKTTPLPPKGTGSLEKNDDDYCSIS